METQDIWRAYKDEIYFFILKKVREENPSRDIFQNVFLKIHKSKHQLNNPDKVKAWTFQIVRNEIANYFNQESKYVNFFNSTIEDPAEEYQHICCFDRFVDNLPETYKKVFKLVYLKGENQKEAAKLLDISLANVKARIRRGKAILKKNFNTCCGYDFDDNGKLVGQVNCAVCDEFQT